MFLFQRLGRSNITIMREYVAIKNMATTMEYMHAYGIPTTPNNLHQHGYTAAEITRYGLKAAHLARSLSVKNVN